MTPPRFLYSAIFLISLAAIGYEILLMRLLSIIQWHHFAYMIISLALLGYAASGTLIALSKGLLKSRLPTAIAVSGLIFSVTMVVCFMIGQRVPFNALEVVWNPGQLIYLSAIYLLFFVPFFFAASCVGLALTCLRGYINRIYFFDLLGAGTGALTTIAALFLLSPQNTLRLLAVVALSASALVSSTAPTPARKPIMVIQMFCLLVLLVGIPRAWLELNISPFKGLIQATQVVDANILGQYSNPLGLVTVVESPAVPFRDAPGLSLNTQSVPPEQLAVFTDGDAMSVITRFNGDFGSLNYMQDVTAALPYELLDRPKVLILGAGGGTDVLFALYHASRKVDAVELNPVMIDLVGDTYADFAGHLYRDERVTIHHGEARSFVNRHSERYDLIQVALLDSFSASGSGVQTLSESYLYTVEALAGYLRHLEPGGILAITRWIRIPPRDSLKLVATAVEVLRRQGVDTPGRRFAMIRSWNTSTLLLKNGPLTENEIDTIREFSRTRSFDTAYYPSMPAAEANRYNVLAAPYIFEGTTALLGEDAEAFVSRYKFDIRPTSDDRPYFFNYFRWGSLLEMQALRRHGGAGMIEWAYLILLATLLQAVVIGALLILMPLLLVKRTWPANMGVRMGAYFFLLGIAFMFVEMAFIQKLILFLGHPLYSVAVVLCGFLVFAGVGSHFSAKLVKRFSDQEAVSVAGVVGAISAITLLYVLFLPALFSLLAGLPDVVKIIVSLMVIAPLAFCMGMPFPIGLAKVAGQSEDFIPWAWGLNGYASVLSASMATLLAIEFGFTAVVISSVALYISAALLIRNLNM